jgi:hypothetical protein
MRQRAGGLPVLGQLVRPRRGELVPVVGLVPCSGRRGVVGLVRVLGPVHVVGPAVVSWGRCAPPSSSWCPRRRPPR